MNKDREHHYHEDDTEFANQSHMEHKQLRQLTRPKRIAEKLDEAGFIDEEEARDFARWVK